MHRLALILALLLAAALPAQAQAPYPSRPVKVIVPYAPGGAVDIVARIVTERMRASLGQNFVIENKPGAFGIIGIEEMARAKPDGYTLMVGNVNANAITPVLFAKKMSIDYARDVVAVARLADLPAFVAATTRNFPPKTFAEFIAYAKAHKGEVRYGSVAPGSFPHYDMEVLARRAGLDMVHIPNKAGASGMLNDLVTGDTQVAFINTATTAPMIRAGELRALAVITPERLPDWPDVPTLAELGYGGIGTLQWIAFFAPSGVPAQVRATIHQAAIAALADPSLAENFKRQQIRTVPSASPEEAQAWLASEIAKWRAITDEVKLELPD